MADSNTRRCWGWKCRVDRPRYCEPPGGASNLAGIWGNAADEPTHDSGLGFHVATLDVSRLPRGERIEFTWQWQESGAGHGRDYQVGAISADET
jgi:hypothetical protein